jgi:hypothetical protein
MTASRSTVTCFVISPIGEDGTPERSRADQVFRHLIGKTLLPPAYVVLRGDQDTNPGLITPSLIASLAAADLIIADLSDRNPNVYYELAIAHSMAKPVVHVQRAGERLPFDVKDIRTISYDLTDPDRLDAAREQLLQSVRYTLEHPDRIATPLSGAGRLIGIQASNNPIAESQADMAAAVDNLRSQLDRGDAHLFQSVTELRDEVRRGFALLARGLSVDDEPVDGEPLNEAAARVGIRRISLDGGSGAVMAEQLAAASTIRILSTSAVRLIEVHQRAITQALARGCELTLLLPEPDGDFIHDVEEIEATDLIRYSRISGEIAEVESRLRALLDQSLAERQNLADTALSPRVRVGHFSTQLRCTMVLCDDEWGWLTLTLPPLRTLETVAFELVATETRSLLSACVTHFGAILKVLQSRDRIRNLHE